MRSPSLDLSHISHSFFALMRDLVEIQDLPTTWFLSNTLAVLHIPRGLLWQATHVHTLEEFVCV